MKTLAYREELDLGGHRGEEELNVREASLHVENLHARVVRQTLSFVQRAHEEGDVSFGKL